MAIIARSSPEGTFGTRSAPSRVRGAATSNKLEIKRAVEQLFK